MSDIEKVYEDLKEKILSMRNEINKQEMLKLDALIKVQQLERFLIANDYTTTDIADIYKH